MGKEAAKWHKIVEPHFGFLVQLGFATVAVDDSSFWSIWVQYRSETSAIRVSKSNEFIRSAPTRSPPTCARTSRR
jgi:hypothetical protein